MTKLRAKKAEASESSSEVLRAELIALIDRHADDPEDLAKILEYARKAEVLVEEKHRIDRMNSTHVESMVQSYAEFMERSGIAQLCSASVDLEGVTSLMPHSFNPEGPYPKISQSDFDAYFGQGGIYEYVWGMCQHEMSRLSVIVELPDGKLATIALAENGRYPLYFKRVSEESLRRVEAMRDNVVERLK